MTRGATLARSGPGCRTANQLPTAPLEGYQGKPMERTMRLNSSQVEQTLTQFQAQVIPDDHPVVPELNALFGDHTFFLDHNGLHVVEPNESTEANPPAGKVVNLANWSDDGLAPHEPQPTEIVVMLERRH
jgi:hypothetical protein